MHDLLLHNTQQTDHRLQDVFIYKAGVITFLKSMLLSNFLIRWSLNILNKNNILMMLNKSLIQWFWVNVTTKPHFFVQSCLNFIRFCILELVLLTRLNFFLIGLIKHFFVVLFFKGWWHLVAFIFTCSYIFLRGYRAGCMICCFTTHSRQTIEYTARGDTTYQFIALSARPY